MILNKNNRRLVKKTVSKLILYKQKQVIQIPEQARFGNLLYFFLHAYISKKNNKNVYILHTKTMDDWLNYFPKLNEFVIRPDKFIFFDNLDWFSEYYQVFGLDFSKEILNEFIDQYIINSEYFKNKKIKNNTTINIRRGDFYKEGKTLPSSFDQIEYLEKVIKDFPNVFSDYSIEIVSDDVNWCEDNLSHVFEKNDLYDIQYNHDSGPLNDFISICTSKNLIINNSTFSYWGGYINCRLNKENNVISPSFGATYYKDSIAVQLHPEWNIVDI